MCVPTIHYIKFYMVFQSLAAFSNAYPPWLWSLPLPSKIFIVCFLYIFTSLQNFCNFPWSYIVLFFQDWNELGSHLALYSNLSEDVCNVVNQFTHPLVLYFSWKSALISGPPPTWHSSCWIQCWFIENQLGLIRQSCCNLIPKMSLELLSPLFFTFVVTTTCYTESISTNIFTLVIYCLCLCFFRPSLSSRLLN